MSDSRLGLHPRRFSSPLTYTVDVSTTGPWNSTIDTIIIMIDKINVPHSLNLYGKPWFFSSVFLSDNSKIPTIAYLHNTCTCTVITTVHS